jgi:ribosomal protein L11 methyltransferase
MVRAARSGPWKALVLEVPRQFEDEVAGGLAPFALGAELEPAAPESTTIRVILRSRSGAAEARAGAEGLLRGFGLDPLECRLRVEEIEDGRWVEKFHDSLRPIPLGVRFLVAPRGDADNPEGRIVLALTPGRAFGTGEHATTQLCVEQLERRVEAGSRWLDLGCGTGLLAMVASHCGASDVLAVDHDEEALAVAREVVEANGLSAAVRSRLGSLDQAGEKGGWDGIVANIHIPFFLENGPELTALLRSGGLLIVSGVLEEDLQDLDRSLGRAGVRPLERVVRRPWAVWVGRGPDR